MSTIDFTNMSAHVMLDRKFRIDLIEKTVGFGTPCAEMPNREDPESTIVLTTTGVIVVISKTGMIITTWIANVRQADKVYKTYTNGKMMPKNLWAIVNYNNNTETWHRMAA